MRRSSRASSSAVAPLFPDPLGQLEGTSGQSAQGEIYAPTGKKGSEFRTGPAMYGPVRGEAVKGLVNFRSLP
jgi:hypothetical protein